MGLMKKLTSVLVASSLVLGSVGFALADTTGSVQDAYSRLEGYKLVAGVPDENGIPVPALDAPVTRAQLATVIVRSFGHEETAGYLKGTSSFSDVAANAWYSGYVAMIKNLSEKNGIAVGYEDGSFRPEKQVSAIEALAFLMKVLGIQPGTGATWAQDTLRIAIDNGLITEADAEAYLSDLNAPASRGLAFAIVDAVFRTATVDGKTLYQVYVDDEAPVLVVDQPAEPTTTKAGDTITGNVQGAEALYLGSEAITVDEEGNFSVEVTFELGENEFVFTAVDAAGNVAEAAYKITRVPGEAAAVKVELGDGTIVAGSEAELVIKLVDENEAEIEFNAEDVKVTIGGEIGSYDKETGIFTASEKAGSGTITVTIGDLSATAEIKVVAGEFEKVTASKDSANIGEKVSVLAVDKYGNPVEGAEFSVDSAEAFIVDGVFVGTAPGTYTVTAKVGDKEATLTIGVYGATAKVDVVAPSEMVANSVGAPNPPGGTGYDVTIRAIDRNGHVNYGEDTKTVKVSAPGLRLFKVDEKGNVGEEVTQHPNTDATVLRFDNGVIKLKAYATIAGRAITMSVIPVDAGIASGQTTVNTVFQVPTSVAFDGSTVPKLVASNSDGTIDDIKVRVLDQAGKRMLYGYYTVNLTVTGPATFTDGTTTKAITIDAANDNGKFQLSKVVGGTGEITLTATVDGLGSATASIRSVVAGPAAKLEIGVTKASDNSAVTDAVTVSDTEGYIFTISVVDAQGAPAAQNVPSSGDYTVQLNPTTLTGLKIYVGQKDTDGNWVWSDDKASTISNGKLTVPIQADGQARIKVQSTKFIGTLNVTASKSGLSAGTGAISFKAGDASNIALTKYTGTTGPAVKYFLPVTNPKVTITAQVVDSLGNAVATAGQKVTFKAVEGSVADGNEANALPTNKVLLNGLPGVVTVDTNAEGKAVVEVTAQTLVNQQYTIVILSEGLAVDAGKDQVMFQVVDRVASSMTVELIDSSDRVTTMVNPDADVVRVKVTLKDQWGNPVTGMEEYLSLDIDKIIWDGTKLINNKETTTPRYTFRDAGNGVYFLTEDGSADAAVKIAKAGLQSVNVKFTGTEAGLTASTVVSVRAGAYAGLRILKDGEPVTQAVPAEVGQVYGPYTLQLVDAYGNPVTTAVKEISVTGHPVRTSATGVDYTTLKVSSSVTFYVAVPGNVTVTFTEGSNSAQIQFVVP